MLATRNNLRVKNAKPPNKRKDILHIFTDGIPYRWAWNLLLNILLFVLAFGINIIIQSLSKLRHVENGNENAAKRKVYEQNNSCARAL